MTGGPGFGRALLAFALASTLALAGCATPRRAEDRDASPSTTALGVDAVLAPEVAGGPANPSSSGGQATTSTSGAGEASGPSATAGAGSGATSEDAPRAYVELVRQPDAAGDHGSAAASYADAVTLVVETAEEHVRVTVELGDQPPAALANGEVMGIGVDFFERSVAVESDYQLFADGSSEGWTAYFETPGGRVRYPGTLTLGRNKLVWELPWSALGGKRALHVSAFADWSNGQGAFGEDFLPDIGKVRIQP